MSILRTKYKLDRRAKVNVLGRKKSPVNKRPYVPGLNPKGKQPTSSAYGEALLHKQKCKRVLCFFKEFQFAKVVQKAKTERHPIQSLINVGSLRLVSVVYRAMWAATPWAAKQLVSHGHVLVNDKKVNVGECLLKLGDVITLRCKDNVHVKASMTNGERTVPGYLKIEGNKCTIIGEPSISDSFLKGINMSSVLEQYR